MLDLKKACSLIKAITPVNRANLVLIKKQVIKNGTIFTQGFWVTLEQARAMSKNNDPIDLDKYNELSGTKEGRLEAMKYLQSLGIQWEEVKHLQQNWLKAQKAISDFMSSVDNSSPTPVPSISKPVEHPKAPEVKTPQSTGSKKEAEELFFILNEKMGKEKLMESMKEKGVQWKGSNWLSFMTATVNYLQSRLGDNWGDLGDTPKNQTGNDSVHSDDNKKDDTPTDNTIADDVTVDDTPSDNIVDDKTPDSVTDDGVIPLTSSQNTVNINGKTFIISQEFLDLYNQAKLKPKPSKEDLGVILAMEKIQAGVEPSVFMKTVSNGYKYVKTRDNSPIAKQAKEDAFGSDTPTKDQISIAYSAFNIFKKDVLSEVGQDGRTIIADLTIERGKNSKGIEVYYVIDGKYGASYNNRDKISRLGGKWDNSAKKWWFDGRNPSEFMDKVLEVLRYGEGDIDDIVGKASDSTGQGGYYTGLDKRIPLRSVEGRDYGRIIAHRARIIDGDGKLSPTLSRLLRPHQLDGVNLGIESVEKYGGFLLADGTGAGKTVEELCFASHYLEQGKKVLVLVPNEQVMDTAFQEDAKMLGIDSLLYPLNSGNGFKMEDGKINLVTYNSISKVDKIANYVIMDEAHYMKNKSSVRSQEVKDYIANPGCDGAIFATATPMDKAGHMHYLDKLGLFKEKSFSSIMRKLGYEWKDNRLYGGKWERYKPLKECAEALDGMFSELEDLGMMVRREVTMDKVSVNFNEIHLPPELNDEMRRLEKVYADNIAVMLMAQRRFQEPYKVPHVLNMTKQAIKEGRQVVIFANRVNDSEAGDVANAQTYAMSESTIKMLIEQLEKENLSVAKIFGGADVKAEMEAFNSGLHRVAVVTPEKGGVGLNLDDKHGIAPRTMIVMTPPFSAMENVQMAGRVNRLTTVSDVKIEYIFGDTAVEQWNRKIISEKMSTLHAVVKGSIGKLKID